MYSQDELVRAEPCAESRQCEGHGLDSYVTRLQYRCTSGILPPSQENQFYLCVCLTKYISYNPTALPFTLSGLSPTCTTVLITTAVSKSISSGLVSNPVRVAFSRGSVTLSFLGHKRVRASIKIS